jgi:hypothetical protein
VLRHHHVRGVEFAVADNLDARDVGNLLADQFEDRATEVASDALVGLGALETVDQKAVVEPLRREEKRCISAMRIASVYHHGVGSPSA